VVFIAILSARKSLSRLRMPYREFTLDALDISDALKIIYHPGRNQLNTTNALSEAT
jgi:hypothetical protein